MPYRMSSLLSGLITPLPQDGAIKNASDIAKISWEHKFSCLRTTVSKLTQTKSLMILNTLFLG